MFFFDTTYMLIGGAGFILSMAASAWVRSSVRKWGQVPIGRNMTGRDVAQLILNTKNIHNVTIEQVSGVLSDHYDPSTRTLRLSPENYSGKSIAAAGIAAHEVGHAIQHAHKYAALSLRSALVPATNLSTGLAFPAMMLGMFLSIEMFVLLGVVLFSMGVVFALVTLPVECDASHRAKSAMVEARLLSSQEKAGASAVLNAAFLTYLAAALTNILILVYYLFRLGILGGSDD